MTSSKKAQASLKEATVPSSTDDAADFSNILDRVRFRDARPTDIPACFDIEKASYPADEAASMSSLQYRQHHVAPYFRVAILLDEAEAKSEALKKQKSKTQNSENKKTAQPDGDIEDDEAGQVVGFICSTRCRAFTEQSLATHVPGGPLLAIHSVAVDAKYRRQGIATTMLQDYIQTVFDRHYGLRADSHINATTADMVRSGHHSTRKTKRNISKLVLMAKAHLLTFYLQAGFSVLRPSPIVHGAEQWYDLELDLLQPDVFRDRLARSKTKTTTPTIMSPPLPCLDCFVVDAFCDPQEPDGTGNPAAIVICSLDPTEAATLINSNSIELEEEGEEADNNNNNGGETNNNNNKNAPNFDMIWDDPATRKWMQQVAAEFNLAETAFVWRLPDEIMEETDANKSSGSSSSETPETARRRSSETSTNNNNSSSAAADTTKKPASKPPKSSRATSTSTTRKNKQMHFGIRYYTPAVEIPLCGHATLASAAVLYQTVTELLVDNKNETVLVFHARRDILTAELRSLSSAARTDTPLTRITMEFPTKPATLPLNDAAAVRSMMHSALGVDLEDILHVGLSEIGDVLVELTYESLWDLSRINYEAFWEWDGYSRGVIVCCENLLRQRGGDDAAGDAAAAAAGDDTASQFGGSRTGLAELAVEDVDFYSRFFAPKAGINEDPVTGSAHCVLAPYFGAKFNKDHVVGHQLSKRGGVVDCQLVTPKNKSNNNSGSTTVKLTGSASTVMTGTLWMKRSVELGESVSNVLAIP